jgi:hypothetical protein
MNEITWTAREALACAYCWAEFNEPEKTGYGSPETYWLSITEAARNDCRRVANRRLLLAVARGEAVAMLPPPSFTPDAMGHFATKMGLTAMHRVRRNVESVWKVLRMRANSDEA